MCVGVCVCVFLSRSFFQVVDENVINYEAISSLLEYITFNFEEGQSVSSCIQSFRCVFVTFFADSDWTNQWAALPVPLVVTIVVIHF